MAERGKSRRCRARHDFHSPRRRVKCPWSTRDWLTRRRPPLYTLYLRRLASRNAPLEYPVNCPTRFRCKSRLDSITKARVWGTRQTPERTLGDRRWEQRAAWSILEEQTIAFDFGFPTHRSSPGWLRNHEDCRRLGNVLHCLLPGWKGRRPDVDGNG